MYSLFIDTHDKNINLVLYKNGVVLKHISKESLKSHSLHVITLIKEIISSSNIDKNDIKEIIVVNGPGSFTGIRIGITIAKTWAFCKEIKIKQISSLEVLAVNIKTKDKIIGIPDAKGYYIGKFTKDNKKVEEFKYYPHKLVEDNLKNIFLEDTINIDYNLVYEYTTNLDYCSAHEVNPIYIKKIGVEDD